jgi:hypothetical protein
MPGLSRQSCWIQDTVGLSEDVGPVAQPYIITPHWVENKKKLLVPGITNQEPIFKDSNGLLTLRITETPLDNVKYQPFGWKIVIGHKKEPYVSPTSINLYHYLAEGRHSTFENLAPLIRAADEFMEKRTKVIERALRASKK